MPTVRVETSLQRFSFEGDKMTIDFHSVSQTQKDAITWQSEKGFTEKFYFGGLGCGKTVAGGVNLLRYAVVPHTPILVVRRTLKTLKASTLKNWLRPELPILHRGLIKYHNRELGHFDFFNGSYIDSVGVGNIDDILTREYAYVFIDELPQISKEHYDTIKGRLRAPHPLGQCLMSAFNPCSIYSWVYEYLQEQTAGNNGMFRAFRGTTTENKKLPPQYEEMLRASYSPRQIEMLINGKFMPEENTLFFAFSQRNIGDFPLDKRVRDAVIFQDYGGGTGDCGLLLAWLFGDGSCYISDEHVKGKMTHEDAKVQMEKLWKKTGFDDRRPQVVYDVANASLARSMRRWGWDVYGADKGLETGINQCNDMFGQGKILIHPACKTLISGLEMLTREDLAKKRAGSTGWDAQDALRYGIMWLTDDVKAAY